MPLLIGALLALVVAAFATIVGFDRERGFYPIVMIVIASYYCLFAIIGGGQALAAEIILATPFVTLAVAGFKRRLWLVAFSLMAHGVMDAGHSHLVSNDGAPLWWPVFCASFDLVAGTYLALRLSKSAAFNPRQKWRKVRWK